LRQGFVEQRASVEDPQHAGSHPGERLRLESAGIGMEQGHVSLEQLSRPREARHAETTLVEVFCGDFDRLVVAIRLAGHLAENPIAPAGIGENDRRPQFRL
jgi:hypothetical protein